MEILFTKTENENTEEIKLSEFLDFLNKVMAEYMAEHKHVGTRVFTAEPGKKYIRIVDNHYYNENNNPTNRSVYCFLDFQGNIYKSASWKIPAKHIRGSIFDSEYSWGKSLGPYGAIYLR